MKTIQKETALKAAGGERLARLGGGYMVVVVNKLSEDTDDFRKKHGFAYNKTILFTDVELTTSHFIATSGDNHNAYACDVSKYIAIDVIAISSTDNGIIGSVKKWVIDNARLLNDGLSLGDF